MESTVDVEKQPLLASNEVSKLQIRPARLADAHVLASITMQSFRNAPFFHWVSFSGYKSPPQASSTAADQAGFPVPSDACYPP